MASGKDSGKGNQPTLSKDQRKIYSSCKKYEVMKIINPATEELLQDIREDDAATLQEKFDRLKKAQSSWYAAPLKNRVEVLVKFSSLLEKNIESLAAVLTSEVGKPLQQSRNE